MCKKKDYCYFYEIHMNTLEKLDKNDLLKKKWFAKNNSCWIKHGWDTYKQLGWETVIKILKESAIRLLHN